MLVKDKEVKDIDGEWLKLILEAKELGLSIESVQQFLDKNKSNS